MRLWKSFLAISLLLFIIQNTYAHHSTSNFNFDESARVTITGEASYWSLTNPHSFIKIDVTSAEGSVAQYTIFLTARAVLHRHGWRRESIKIGDKIEIEGSPDKKNPKELYLQRIVFADGKVWRRDEVRE